MPELLLMMLRGAAHWTQPVEKRGGRKRTEPGTQHPRGAPDGVLGAEGMGGGVGFRGCLMEGSLRRGRVSWGHSQGWDGRD